MRRANTGLYLDQELVARARAAVVALEGTPHDVGNLSAIVERHLRAEIEALEQAHNGGEPFPPVAALPRGSRRKAPASA